MIASSVNGHRLKNRVMSRLVRCIARAFRVRAAMVRRRRPLLSNSSIRPIEIDWRRTSKMCFRSTCRRLNTDEPPMIYAPLPRSHTINTARSRVNAADAS
ncbi:hypothetical protein EVAR_71476_1 [Eumeta japonica]|uniref:Uncharacterized protein n=1 Tax=Eumeta variegata TaxID=151549 RepID=A0A4C1SGX0_EUMVA|nr:hypothetical protein EVAR_71476_1 [Eumeta japonica]